MQSSIIKQATSKHSLFSELSKWCTQGAGKKTSSLKILSAFASGKGIEALTPFFDIFLADGNTVEVIFGIDRNGTDRDAVLRLYALQKAYPWQFSAKYFHAPSRSAIFHPKLYIYKGFGRLNYILGSANLTYSGLGSNFESLQLFENLGEASILARQAQSIWQIYATPTKPLLPEFLHVLSEKEVAKLIKKLPRHSEEDKKVKSGQVSKLWKPLSKISLPRSGEKLTSNRRLRLPLHSKYLVMDVLTETRRTQMQIPLAVIRDFFDFQVDAPAEIKISLITDMGLSQPILRKVVISGLNHKRLMRRLEMPQIRDLPRPLVVVFVKLGGSDSFAYYLVQQSSSEYKPIYKLLDQVGQQGAGQRRYYIGNRGDANWPTFSTLLERD
jgi:HKD family nuclease